MADYEKSDTEKKVIDIVAQTLSLDKEPIKPDDTFEKLGADSLDMFEIVLKLEEVFEIEISDEDATKITSLNDAIEKVHSLRTK